MKDLNDLIKNDLSGTQGQSLLLSNIYKVIKGGFDTNGVETYLGSAQVSLLANDIEVFERLTEDKSWPVSSIIQRDVDDRRVKEIANDFILKASNNVKYFPPIIIAIVPRESSEEISKSFKSTNEDLSNPIRQEIHTRGGYNKQLLERFYEAKNHSILDGFYVLDYLDGIASYPLCWDRSKIYAIVIDGQHRLEALKYAMTKKHEIGTYHQDIVFLDLSKKAISEGRNPVEAIRRIFIDINYNAKRVTNARRTLMDDKDLSSLIVQSLVNDDDQNGTRTGRYLEPQIVDWHSENLKHSFPQITGVLVLQQLIEDNFLAGSNVSSISDLRESKKVDRFVSTLNSRFIVDYQISNKTKYIGIQSLSESHSTYKKLIEQQTESDDKEDLLFSMDYNVLNVARDSFEEIYSKSVVKFFNDVLPYRKAIDVLRANSVFDISDIRHRLIVKNPKKYSDKEKEKIDELSSTMRSSLDEKYYLWYTVLGQKTLFRHYFKELVRHLSQNDVNEATVIEFTEKWITTINLVLEKLSKTKLFKKDQECVLSDALLKKYNISNYGLVAESFWQGIIYNEQNIVYNNQGIEGLLGVIDYAYKTFPIRLVNNEIVFPDDTVWFNISYSPTRTKNKLKQEFSGLDISKYEEVSYNIWSAKLELFKEIITQGSSDLI
jgi:DGQHR domain-containing protein